MKAFWMAGLLLAVAVAGCTEQSDEFEVPPQDDEGRYVIEMLPAQRFRPENAEVPAGATVVWVNEGGAHNTQARDGLWKTAVTADKGEHFEFTFTEEHVGDHAYLCKPHESSGMLGTIRVTA